MEFDAAYQPVIAGGSLFYGSSADGKVYALDGATGRAQWTFFTGGPIRFAPAAWRDRLFVASDDGYLYCLSAMDGSLVWAKRGGPEESLVLGNGRMISRWPARGGPVVVGDTVYFCAGIWPSEGIFLYALDAASGREIWLNNSSGSLVLNQPHPGARAQSGVSAQGYLAASEDVLVVPTGRAVPAVFGRDDGSFRYFHLQKHGHRGGSGVAVVGDLFLNAECAYWIDGGELFVNGMRVSAAAAGERFLFFADGGSVKAVEKDPVWEEKETADRRGEPERRRVFKEAAWTLENAYTGKATSLIVTRNAIVVGSDTGVVVVIDAEARAVRRTLEVVGIPFGLAAADDRLYVSTDGGRIYCFGEGRGESVKVIETVSDTPGFEGSAVYEKAAEEILAKTGVTKGYCLDIGCADGRLAYELARRTELSIVGIEADPETADRARRRLDAAGLLGVRVSVFEGDLSSIHLPPYFANLVVSGRSVEGAPPEDTEELRRVVRPWGGVRCFGRPGDMYVRARGELEGAGEWTHQYANAANTACSGDTLVRSPLGVSWFADNRLAMPSRHGRGPAPLFGRGRLFVEGLHGIEALDAYNGTHLWEFSIPDVLVPYDQEHLVGTAATGSNMCLGGNSLYVRTEDRCLRLDAATGHRLGEFHTPETAEGTGGTWGFIACADGTLFGSVANERHIVTWAFRTSDMNGLFSESNSLFALDAETGEPKWTYSARNSIRHNAIAIGGGRVYLIDRPAAEFDRLGADGGRPKRRGETPDEAGYGNEAGVPGTLVALDTRTGEAIWKRTEEIPGTLLALSVEHDILLTARQHTRFELPSEDIPGAAAYRASTGDPLWKTKPPSRKGYPYSSRPVVNGTRVYFEPGALDLLTGGPLKFSMERSYACGILSGARHLLAFRSATLGYIDLTSGDRTQNYGGVRPGCWINAIPAGGILLVPDASSRCTCSYLIKSSLALAPLE
jgi:outer membrane protein assembly factor BamB